ncbi:MAG: site-specific DNA-methyltransferase [Thermoguttaceae bacterium]|nr:site-specific DNA-methyltransferase [Thermoguttaceae bacterium]
MERETNVEKMRMESVDLISKNVEKIAELFPECVTEAADKDGALRRLVDFDKLRQLLSGDVAEEPERYDFTWVGKRAALAEAHTPVRKTLRPCPEESRDWDTTQNLYIEGDNLDVLKLLQESYLGKVKMIYIDPPYNTGNDFIYRDDFSLDNNEYNDELGVYDDNNNRLFRNTDSNGRFHSDWCSMIYSRLILAQNLLSDDGVIFISIDDNEDRNLWKICDDVFQERNFVAQCVRKRRNSQANLSRNISPIHEYVLIYCKKQGDKLNKVAANIDELDYKNPDNDPRGPYKTMPCTNKGGSIYTVTTPTGNSITEEWRFKRETYYQLLSDNRLVFPRSGEGKPRYKIYLSEKQKEGQLANTWLDTLASNQEATREIKALFGDEIVFDTPKPVGLLEFCIQLSTNKDSIVLDFFSGSATTAHAVIKQNAIDGGKRKFIMVQLPEHCNEKSLASRTNYSNICEIGKERIRRAGDKIKAENPLTTKDLDIGFRVLKVDSANMNDVYYGASEVSQDLIKSAESNVKDDRTDLDLLFGCLLDWGLPLSLPYKSEKIDGVTIHDYNSGDLIACFAENVPQKAFEKVVETIAKREPIRAVFRDSCFETDAAKINVTEIFKRYSPDTRIKTI